MIFGITQLRGQLACQNQDNEIICVSSLALCYHLIQFFKQPCQFQMHTDILAYIPFLRQIWLYQFLRKESLVDSYERTNVCSEVLNAQKQCNDSNIKYLNKCLEVIQYFANNRKQADFVICHKTLFTMQLQLQCGRYLFWFVCLTLKLLPKTQTDDLPGTCG